MMNNIQAKKLLETPVTRDRNAHILNGLLKLDSKNRLDPHLFSHILEYQAYDPYLHTPEYAITSRNIELGNFLIENDLWYLLSEDVHVYLDYAIKMNDDDAIVYIASITHADPLSIRDTMRKKYNAQFYCSSKLADFIVNNYTPARSNSFHLGVILLRQEYLSLDMSYTYVSEGWVNWYEVLVESAWGGYIDIVRYVVEQQGVDVTFDRNLAAFYAAYKGHLEVVKYLIERGADATSCVISRGSNYCTQLNIIYYCLQHGASANDVLMVAIRDNVLDLVKCAIDHGADVTFYNNLPIRDASEKGNFEIVKYLIEYGADININMGAPLTFAVTRGNIDMVKYLIRKGAHMTNNYNITKAAQMGRIDIVKCLVKNGSDVKCWDNDSLRAATLGRHVEIVKYLVEQGADAKDTVCLENAARKGSLELVKYFVEQGTAITSRSIRFAHNRHYRQIVNYLNEQLLNNK